MLSTPKSRGEFFLASSLRDGLEDNDIKQVETLLSCKEADPNVLIPTHGISPFHLVMGNESEKFAEQVTKLFLRHGGNPNVRSADGMTPVHVAAAWGRVRVLELLLANGGDPLCLDDDGRSPFHYAFDGAYYDAVATLGKYCGMNQDEEECNEPKYKLTLDKIFVNKGNVVAEYVTSEDSCSVTVKTESSQSDESSKRELEQKKLQGVTLNPRPSYRTANRDGSTGDDCNWSQTNNVTLRRYQKNRKQTKSGGKIDCNVIGECSMEEERLLVGQIINRLSNTFLSNDSTIIGKTMKNERTRLTTVMKKPRRFISPSKYHSCNIKSKDTPHKRLVDTSIISKSPNCRITVANENKTRTPSNKRRLLESQSHSCRKSYYNNETTPPLRPSKSSQLRIKSASSTPKKKQYNGRLYGSAKFSKKIEKSKNLAATRNRDRTLTIFDKTYSKGQYKITTDSPDTVTKEWNFDRKYGAQKIAVNLDARMYDENPECHEHYCDPASSSNSCENETEISSPLNRELSKPVRIYNDIKKGVVNDGKNRQRCNVGSSESKIPIWNNLLRTKSNIVNESQESKLRSTAIPRPLEIKVQEESKKNLDFPRNENRAYVSILESPGSSNPISACRLENSGSFIPKRFDLNDNEDDVETKILLEIEEASKERCGTPPASVSMLETGDSPCSMHNSSLDDLVGNTTYYSESIRTDDLSIASEFYEASTNIPTSPRIIASWSHCESLISVDEEYTYEDAEEGVAFIERHLCVIPSSTQDDMNRAKEESSWIDRLGELSIASNDEYSPGKLTRSTLFDDKALRERLTALGEMPGPITKTTFNVYLKRLWRLERGQKNTVKATTVQSAHEADTELREIQNTSKIPELLLSIDWTTKQQMYRNLEEQAFKEYATANPKRKYRGGISKTSFCYLLLDPRITKDLPRCGIQLSVQDRWQRFLNGVFYVGKGKAARPAAHLYDAFGVWSKRQGIINDASRKIRRILDIWQDGQGVVCLHVFSHTMMEEACSREAAMIDALETAHLTNCLRGTYYGYATTMSTQEKRSLGKYLLYKSMEIFMHEGERQLFPRNVIM